MATKISVMEIVGLCMSHESVVISVDDPDQKVMCVHESSYHELAKNIIKYIEDLESE